MVSGETGPTEAIVRASNVDTDSIVANVWVLHTFVNILVAELSCPALGTVTAIPILMIKKFLGMESQIV